jgi:6-phosphogluconolactonase
MTYERLAKSDADWERWHLFWGDERCVPPDHKSSNYRMAWDTLLSKVPIPTQNLYRIRGELEPVKAARAYLRELRHFFGFTQQRYGVSAAGVFSLILLGLGEDGHTASIFPDSPAYEERERWVVALEHDRPPPPLVPRVTITLPVINAARNVVFLVSGKAKAGRVAQVLAEVETDPPSPAQLVRPHHGRLTWLLNKYAASTWSQAQS